MSTLISNIHLFVTQYDVYSSLWLKKELEKRDNIMEINSMIQLNDILQFYKMNIDQGKIGYIFFFHWSTIVPKEIYEHYNCVVIHTSNLPDGRGGSPLQNQIVDEIIHTRVNAIKMVKELDAGPIYMNIPITLQGTISDIWMTIAQSAKIIIFEMIENPNLEPITQLVRGDEKKYHRRKDNQLRLEDYSDDGSKIYDFIRMLDGGKYPKAYIEIGNYRLEFSRASFDGQEILADVTITKKQDKI